MTDDRQAIGVIHARHIHWNILRSNDKTGDGNMTKLLDKFEQAITATLGSDAKPCYATDYTHKRCKYSVNRGWTEDTKFYVPTMRHGTLTAEQVREAIEANSWAETSTIREFNDSSWQAIADELNAELGGGNCARCAEDMGRYADSLCDPLKERIAELLRYLENDWHIHASWDGLRKFWCIELTEEGVKLRDAARAERTCKPNWVLQFETQTQEFWCCECGNCGECFGVEDRSSFPFKVTIDKVDIPKYCPNCGCKVVDE